MRRVFVALVAALCVVPAGSAAAPDLPLSPCTLPGGIAARCGTFRVPEDRSQQEGRSIALRVAVLPARDGGSAADPLVHLAGGPGGSAIGDAGFSSTVFSEVNATRDVVLVDQRGTGGSNRLVCPLPGKGLDLTKPAVLRAYVRSCLNGLSADPRQYTTVPAMDDLADALRALGYSKVNLYGGSYGATAAQYFLAQHPDLVRTTILDGATLLDVPLFELWGRNGQRALKGILRRCATTTSCARAFPRVGREVFEVIAGLRRKPVRLDGGTVLDAAAAAGTIQWLSRSPAGAAQIPWIAHRARVGDWLPLELALDDANPGIATRQVMFWSIVCNEPWARWDPVRTARASRGTYLAARTARDSGVVAAVCASWPKMPQPTWSATRVRSDAPVLIVVGGSDPQDPLSNVANAARELPNSTTVLVPNAGHGSVQVGCMPRVAAEFVERGSAVGLDPSCVARYRPPPFVGR